MNFSRRFKLLIYYRRVFDFDDIDYKKKVNENIN